MSVKFNRQFPMMIGRCGTLAMAFACFGAAFLDTGCVAIPMGKETFTHTDTIYETASSPCRSDVVSVTPQCVQRGEVAIAKIGLEVQEEYERYSHQETVTVHKRKKLAVGILPGFASIAINPSDGILAPEMELNPNDTKDIYQSRQRWLAAEFLMPFSFGVLNGFTTFCSLFCGHFEEYETFPVTREWAGPYWDRLQRFPKSDQAKIGMFGASTETARAVKRGSSLGLVGVHKYFKLKIDPMQRSVSVPAGTSTQCKSMAAIGPYMTQFEIPALGHKNWKQVPRGDTQATFDLPKVSRDCTVEAVVTFQAAPTASGTPSDLTRQALAKVANREWRFDLVLKGTGTQPPPRQPIVPIRPQPPPKPLYEIESIEPLGDGQYVVRAKIIDKSKTFDIGRMLEPEVKRKIREDFSATHLGVPVHEIRENVQWKTEKSGSMLIFTGWAFSVRPVEDGWSYDSETRRGWIRLRVTGGMPAEDAKRWARDNISAIVSEKNVVLEAGKAPPPDATYRSLNELYENGILTVEFQAEQ